MANNLRQIRDALGLSLAQVASQLGVSRVSVHRWEVGKTSPTLERLTHLATIYHVPIEDLICENYVPRSPALVLTR